jgi:hypothetical protein
MTVTHNSEDEANQSAKIVVLTVNDVHDVLPGSRRGEGEVSVVAVG